MTLVYKLTVHSLKKGMSIFSLDGFLHLLIVTCCYCVFMINSCCVLYAELLTIVAKTVLLLQDRWHAVLHTDMLKCKCLLTKIVGCWTPVKLNSYWTFFMYINNLVYQLIHFAYFTYVLTTKLTFYCIFFKLMYILKHFLLTYFYLLLTSVLFFLYYDLVISLYFKLHMFQLKICILFPNLKGISHFLQIHYVKDAIIAYLT